MAKKFPDLNKDGKVTQADILKGRGVYNEGGITAKEHINVIFSLLGEGKYNNREAILAASRELDKANSEKELKDLKRNIYIKFAQSNKNYPEETNFFPTDIKNKIDSFKLGDSAYKVFGMENENRKSKAEGGALLVPVEMETMPVDTYPNIPPEEMDDVMASQKPDEEMEDDFVEFVLGQSLEESEMDYLMDALEADDQLSMIFDKVILASSEFSGAGEVEGPGDGTSDSIPARLSDGEFVFTKKATDQIGADNLQTMMDDAERAYDGGLMKMAIGGMVDNPMMEDSKLPTEEMSEEELKKQMLDANRMPSLMNR